MEEEKGNTKDLVKEFEKIKKEKMPKEEKTKIIKKIATSLIKGLLLAGLFIVLNIAYSNMNTNRLENDIKIISGIVFIFSLITFEIAYKKDSGLKAISGLELVAISFYILSTPYLINRFKLDIKTFFIISATISTGYYFIKTIFVYKNFKKEYIKSCSDISDIIKKEEPSKKEALKREIKEDEELKEKTIKKKAQPNKKTKSIKSDKKIEKKSIKKVKEEKEELKVRDIEKDKSKNKIKKTTDDLEPKKKQTRKKVSTKKSEDDKETTTTKTITSKTKTKVKKKDTVSKSTTTKKKKSKVDSKVEGEIDD